MLLPGVAELQRLERALVCMMFWVCASQDLYFILQCLKYSPTKKKQTCRNAERYDDEYIDQNRLNWTLPLFFTMDSNLVISILSSTCMDNNAWKCKQCFKAMQMEMAFENLSYTKYSASFRTFWYWMLQSLPCSPKWVLKRKKRIREASVFILYYIISMYLQ